MSTLPPIGEISRLSKRRKLETASLLTSYEALCNVDLFRCSNSMIDKLSREVKETWLVAKFGLVIMMRRTIPANTLTTLKKRLSSTGKVPINLLFTIIMATQVIKRLKNIQRRIMDSSGSKL